MQDVLERWQKRLGLQDWRVSLCTKDAAVFPSRGQVTWDADTKTAQITLRDGDPDAEETLVHELVHLHFVDCVVVLNILEPFIGSVAIEVAKRQMQLAVERAVERLSAALVWG